MYIKEFKFDGILRDGLVSAGFPLYGDGYASKEEAILDAIRNGCDPASIVISEREWSVSAPWDASTVLTAKVTY